MATGIIALLVAIIPFVIWLVTRKINQADDPKTQNEKRYEVIDQDIANAQLPSASSQLQASLAATAHASDDLDELERLQAARKAREGGVGGSTGNAGASGPDVHGAL